MPTDTRPVPPIPAPTVPLVDPVTGLVRQEWYPFLKQIAETANGLREEIP